MPSEYAVVTEEHFELKVGADGVLGACYFCGAQVTIGQDAALMIVQKLPQSGDPMHEVCHATCAERAKGT
jgi:hypothetical protein